MDLDPEKVRMPNTAVPHHFYAATAVQSLTRFQIWIRLCFKASQIVDKELKLT
jgi:hypothetical protein